MTETQLRNTYIAKAKDYLGSTEGSAKHHEIVDTYNTQNPLPVGYAVTYTDDWCATYTTAMAVLCGLTDIILPECSCSRMLALYEAVGGTKPASYIPTPGDLVLYEWDQESQNGPDHIGIVTDVSGDTITVIEGNKNNTVEYRTITPDYVYIHCYLVPDYASKASTGLTFVTGNRFLTQAEMETNAIYIWDYLGSRGWTLNAVAGMLGNMETESTINPGIWQNLNEGTGPAYGLVQWDPFTKYTEWCSQNGLNPSHMDSALKRIEYELENGLQYYATSAYPLTFKGFKVSTESASYLAMTFLNNYERPADSDQPSRGTQAERWFTFLQSHVPGSGGGGGGDTPTTGTWKPWGKKSMGLLLMVCATRRSGL